MDNSFKIIVPAYNCSKYIKETIDYIKSQEYTNFRCVIVNDCSTDSTRFLVEKYTSDDTRFEVINNASRIYGLASVIKGTNHICKNDEDIVVIVDGDDRFTDGTVLGYLNKAYENPTTWATYGQYIFASNREQGTCRHPEDTDYFYRLDIDKWHISHLRTYKYFLFKLIKDRDLRDWNNNYFRASGDMAVFYPIAEMAGKHLKFLSRINYIYNDKSPLNLNKIAKDEQTNNNQYIRLQPAYKALESKLDSPENKFKIKLYDGNFAHIPYINPDPPQYIEWCRDENFKSNITIYTDKKLELIESKDSESINVAWLMEPVGISSHTYDYIENNYTKFDYILTYDKYLLDKLPNSRFMTTAGSWLYRKDFQIYNKIKNISTIVSEKQDTQYHTLRHRIVKTYGKKFDLVCGRKYGPIKYKLEGLKEFRYLVFIQNTYEDYYFTDNLIDCFLTGTIPVFCGCPSIQNYFDSEGMFTFRDFDEFKEILPYLTEKEYLQRLQAVNNNFIKAHKYACVEDYLYINFLREIIND